MEGGPFSVDDDIATDIGCGWLMPLVRWRTGTDDWDWGWDGRAAPLEAPVGPLSTAQVASLETTELMDVVARAFRVRCAQDAVLATLCAELERREGWRQTGGTSLGSWLVQHLGVSDATARAYVQVAEQVGDLPHVAAGLWGPDASTSTRCVRCWAWPGPRTRPSGPRPPRAAPLRIWVTWSAPKELPEPGL